LLSGASLICIHHAHLTHHRLYTPEYTHIHTGVCVHTYTLVYTCISVYTHHRLYTAEYTTHTFTHPVSIHLNTHTYTSVSVYTHTHWYTPV